MKMNTLRNKNKHLYTLLAFLAPFGSMMLMMLVAGYTPFGDKSMLYSDMWHQYYPFFKAFREALREGKSLIYSWNVGMGLDYLGLISYYLASPLNLLSVLIPDGWVQGYFGMLVPLKLGFAGLFFAIFLKRTFGKNDIFLPLFGWFYGMCAWALGYQWNVMWLDTFALLPLLALGTISLLKDKKFILYTVTLFLSVFVNYYVGFFVCIFVLLLFICYQISYCKSFGRLVADFTRIGIFTVLAIGMTAILTLPALAALQTTQSSVNSYPDGFAMNIVSSTLCAEAKEAWNAFKTAKEAGEEGLFKLWYTALFASFAPILEGMRQVAGNMAGGQEPTFKEGLPNLYCGVGTIVLMFLFLTAKKVRIREKICCVFLLIFFMLSFLLRQLDYIWHGFHFTNMIPYRFSFLFSFVMLYMAYRAFLMRRQFTAYQIIPAGMLALSIMLCSNNYEDTIFLVYNGAFLLMYVFALLLPKIFVKLPKNDDTEGKKRLVSGLKLRRQYAGWALAVIMAVELIANLVNFGVAFPYTSLTTYPKGKEDTASIIRYMKEDKDLFFRAEMTHSQTLNDAALNSYNGISTFTSSANVNVTKFMQYLGYAAKDTYNRYCFEESSPVANLFLNLKYMIERDGRVEENAYFDEVWHNGYVYLLENNAYLPLGFLTEKHLAELVFDEYEDNAFVFQNMLFSAATGLEEDVWDISKGFTLGYIENGTVVISKSATGKCTYNNKEAQTILVYQYQIKDEGFFCVDLNMTARNNFSVWLNGKELYSESISLPQTLSVCQVKPGDIVEIKITCKANSYGNITIRGGLLKDEVFRAGYDILAASTLELTSFEDTRIEGIIDCNRDGLMYTSVPQNGESWSVTVDGEEVPIVLVGECMIAVELTEGTHEIVMTYNNSAFNLGWKISLLCLVIFAGIAVLIYRPWDKNRKGKFEK